MDINFIKQILEEIPQFQKIADDNPTDIKARLKLGDLLSKAGEFEKAIIEYRRACDLYDDNSQYLEIVAIHRQIMRMSPDNYRSAANLVHFYSKLGIQDEALAISKRLGTILAHLPSPVQKSAITVSRDIIKNDTQFDDIVRIIKDD